MIPALLGLALSAASASASVVPVAPAVMTSEGPLVGAREADGSIAFRGIPYARPPVGPLRWKPPQPIRWSAPRAAIKAGSACPQSDYGVWNRKDAIAGREDCLTLELRTPTLTPARPLPVMVWIHGGGNRGGSGMGNIDSDLVSHGVVLVDLNYRLGALGFLSHPALSAESPRRASGNYGLMDQQAALRWVKANIARFGGDPARITIFGESAGGQDVGIQRLLPANRGLFAGAIEQSGSPAFGVPTRSLAEAEALGERLARLAGAPADADAATMRSLPVAALLRAGDAVHVPSVGDDSFVWLQMTVDGVVLPDTPSRLLAKAANPAPLIIGTNLHEFTPTDIKGDARAVIRQRFGKDGPTVFAHYGLSKPGPVSEDRALDIATDLIFRCPSEVVARTRSGGPAWMYRFDHADADGTPVTHGSDIGSVMHRGTGGAATMQDYWLAFARTGRPEAAGLPAWPRFAASRRMVLHFGQDATAVREATDPVCPLTRTP
ncbi:carboxylesterase/lipase family protein [Sphingomonas abietis]|uniref:Carboxylic ester hydrolase n=1 Tax=Sphingomonas abietis TaxID=3012344 RepID=A0ABY7NN02_9SPHN|nr:carboxylesterase family protein [Sphingomonas abietis]WBO21284.1 carboxylesterase family protein [Sphingomonas abietis]